MNDNYLWDRTGEPDAEIQRLEEVLATLRYEPRPLVIPAELKLQRRRMLSPTLAIAATIALMVVAAGLWLALSHNKTTRPSQAQTHPANEIQSGGTAATPVKVEQRQSVQRAAIANGRHVQSLARGPRVKSIGPATAGMTAKERNEAEAAKEQLMLALRVASAKLNLAQRRTQTAPAVIRNQHKIG